MKRITEMTDEEVLALTDADLQNQIKISMAENGIKLLAEPEAPTYADIDSPDETVYEVANLVLLNRESAQSIANAINDQSKYLTKLEYDYHSGSQMYYLNPKDPDAYRDDSVKERRVYSQKLFNEIKEFAKNNAQLKKTYENELSEYRKAYSDAEWVREEIYEKYRDVHKEHERLNQLSNRFAEYLELASGDQEVAIRFLQKAYAISGEDRKYLGFSEVPDSEAVAEEVA